MPRQLLIIVTCDVCGSDTDKTEKSRQTPLSLGRRSVELDLCESCTETLTEAVTPFLEAGRPGHAALAPSLNGERTRSAPEPHECETCHYWFRGAGIHAHQRAGCDGSPPPFLCPQEGCMTGFKDPAKVRAHLATGEHVIPTPAMKKAEKARQREVAA